MGFGSFATQQHFPIMENALPQRSCERFEHTYSSFSLDNSQGPRLDVSGRWVRTQINGTTEILHGDFRERVRTDGMALPNLEKLSQRVQNGESTLKDAVVASFLFVLDPELSTRTPTTRRQVGNHSCHQRDKKE